MYTILIQIYNRSTQIFITLNILNNKLLIQINYNDACQYSTQRLSDGFYM